jgi:16S rRNA C967 or C1407 C5-methylase (RsmB/RsmF family)
VGGLVWAGRAAEGAEVGERFLGRAGDAQARPIQAAWGEAQGPGRRLPPGGDFDGFFYAVLARAR